MYLNCPQAKTRCRLSRSVCCALSHSLAAQFYQVILLFCTGRRIVFCLIPLQYIEYRMSKVKLFKYNFHNCIVITLGNIKPANETPLTLIELEAIPQLA